MKTIYDYHKLFGITTGMKYHAHDYACQACMGSFELYKNAKTEEERDFHYEVAEIIANKLNAPIPINL